MYVGLDLGRFMALQNLRQFTIGYIVTSCVLRLGFTVHFTTAIRPQFNVHSHRQLENGIQTSYQ